MQNGQAEFPYSSKTTNSMVISNIVLIDLCFKCQAMVGLPASVAGLQGRGSASLLFFKVVINPSATILGHQWPSDILVTTGTGSALYLYPFC